MKNVQSPTLSGVFDDKKFASKQLSKREASHLSGAKSKVPRGYPAAEIIPWSGAFVTMKKDINKARDKYIVIKIDDVSSQCWIKKCDNQLRQETYLVKNTEIELCPDLSKLSVNDSLPSTRFPSSVEKHSKESRTTDLPTKLGWDSVDNSSDDDDIIVEAEEFMNDDQSEVDVHECADDQNRLNKQVEAGLESEEVRDTVYPPAFCDAVQIFSTELNDWIDRIKLNSMMGSKAVSSWINLLFGASLIVGSTFGGNSLGRTAFFWWRWKHLYGVDAKKSPEGTRDDG